MACFRNLCICKEHLLTTTADRQKRLLVWCSLPDQSKLLLNSGKTSYKEAAEMALLNWIELYFQVFLTHIYFKSVNPTIFTEF